MKSFYFLKKTDSRRSVCQPVNIQPKRILVITLRYLGDTLLVTPLISSLKQAYPDAEIDVLLPSGNLAMLEGNKDISRLIPMAGKPGIVSFVRLLFRLFRDYDVSISTQAGDRPVLCAILAGKLSLGFTLEKSSQYSWKRLLLDIDLPFNEQHSHAVLENLRFCEPLNIKPCYRVTPPQSVTDNAVPIPDGKYAVLHIMPQWRYKEWHDEGWINVASFIDQQGYQIMLTGSAQTADQERIRKLQQRMPLSTSNLAGQLSLSQLTKLIASSAFFIGPDTGITHLAAATGTTTVAIFGPTDPGKWAPWPFGYAENRTPFASRGNQNVNNVYLVQGSVRALCVPCQEEGCDRNRQSYSACLDGLAAETVIEVIRQLL